MAYQYKREPLTPEEADRLAQACQTTQEKLVIWTLLDTGLRVSEFASLSAPAVSWQGERLTVKGKGGPYGSKSKLRVIPATRRVLALLGAHFAGQDTMGFSVRTIQNIVKRVADRARITRPCHPHILRHTFAVTAAQKGLSLPALQKILGHDHLSTTQIYLNLSPEHVLQEFREKW